MKSIRVLRLNDQVVLGASENTPYHIIARAEAALDHSTTVRKLRSAAVLAAFAPAARNLLPRCSESFSRTLEMIVNAVLPEGTGLEEIAVLVRSKTDRNRDRLYVELHVNERPYAFAKCGRTERDIEHISREIDTLKCLSRVDGLRFQYCHLLGNGLFGPYSTVITAALPAERRRFRSSENDFPQRFNLGQCTSCMIPIDGAEAVAGVPLLPVGAFRDDYNQRRRRLPVDHVVGACFTHGDLGSENVFTAANGSLIVIDWEFAHRKAPHLADQIAFWLGKHHRRIRARRFPHADFIRCFSAGDSTANIDTLLGLAYLHSRGNREAQHVVAAWEDIVRDHPGF